MFGVEKMWEIGENVLGASQNFPNMTSSIVSFCPWLRDIQLTVIEE